MTARSLSRVMGKHARPVAVRTSDVAVVESPSDFYELLCRGISQAKTSITLSTLYMGTHTEKENKLISLLSQASERGVRVKLLLDAMRAKRGGTNPRGYPSSLADTLAKSLLGAKRGGGKGNLSVSLYHTPIASRLTSTLMRPPYGEILGVCHMKAYVFDDTVVMSGANLNEKYFTTRQDRYISIRNAQLAHVTTSIIDAISKNSFRLNHLGGFEEPPGGISPISAPRAFGEKLYSDLTETARGVSSGEVPTSCLDGQNASGEEALVFPLVQLGCINYRQDEEAVGGFLANLSRGDKLQVSSGYLNPTRQLEEAFARSGCAVDFITASPSANGFFQSPKGSPKALIPFVYQSLAYESIRRMQSYQQNTTLPSSSRASGSTVSLYEYGRQGWQYHAKGLWYTPFSEGREAGPLATFIGSPNYGYRSQDKDLEMQFFILSQCENLRERLRVEVDSLFKHFMRSKSQRREKGRGREKVLVSLSSKLCRKWL